MKWAKKWTKKTENSFKAKKKTSMLSKSSFFPMLAYCDEYVDIENSRINCGICTVWKMASELGAFPAYHRTNLAETQINDLNFQIVKPLNDLLANTLTFL